MKILFVHEVDYTSKVIYEIHEFPELLAKSGHQVHFFSFPEQQSRFIRFTKTLKTSGRVYPEVEISLTQASVVGWNDLTRRIFSMTFSYFELWKLMKTKKFDVIFLYAVPTYGIQTCKLANKFDIPVVFRALDVSHKIRDFKLGFIIRAIEKYVYQNSTIVSANNPAMLQYCKKIAGREIVGEVNFPPLDLAHFKGINADQSLLKKYGVNTEKKVVAYLGTFFYFSGIPNFIRSTFKKFGSEWPFTLLLIGGGEQKDEISNLIATLGVSKNVIFTGFIPYALVPKYLAVCDVAINPMEKSLVSDVAFPQKVLQYLAANKPTVSTKLDGIYGVIGDVDLIYWASDSDDQVNGVVKLLNKKNFKSSDIKLNEFFSVEQTLESIVETVKRSINLKNGTLK